MFWHQQAVNATAVYIIAPGLQGYNAAAMLTVAVMDWGTIPAVAFSRQGISICPSRVYTAGFGLFSL